MWQLEGNSVGTVLSLYLYMGAKDLTQVGRPAHQVPLPAGPSLWL